MTKTISVICISLFIGINGLFAQISMKKGSGGLWILDGQNKVAFYQKEEVSVNPESGRANFLHPVYLPDGTEITENSPADHPHHRGIFWAWHQVLIDDKPIGDGWLLQDFKVDVKSVEFKRAEQGNGVLETITQWQSPKWKDGAEAYLQETTCYTFHPQKGNYRQLRIDISLKSLVDNLKLGGSDDEKGYGGFSVRMKLPENIKFIGENSEVEPKNEAIEGGRYMNITGQVGRNGNNGGIIIYAHPANQATPQTWILRKKDSMQNAVFPGHIPVELKKDVPVKLSYTLILYSGKINAKKTVREIAKRETLQTIQ